MLWNFFKKKCVSGKKILVGPIVWNKAISCFISPLFMRFLCVHQIPMTPQKPVMNLCLCVHLSVVPLFMTHKKRDDASKEVGVGVGGGAASYLEFRVIWSHHCV